LEYTEKFLDQFFDKISDIYGKEGKGRHIGQAYWYYLRPTYKSDDKHVQRFKDLLTKVETEDKDNTTFIKLIKETIGDLTVYELSRQASQEYLNQQGI
jgi:hypothetical protein